MNNATNELISLIRFLFHSDTCRRVAKCVDSNQRTLHERTSVSPRRNEVVSTHSTRLPSRAVATRWRRCRSSHEEQNVLCALPAQFGRMYRQTSFDQRRPQRPRRRTRGHATRSCSWISIADRRNSSGTLDLRGFSPRPITTHSPFVANFINCLLGSNRILDNSSLDQRWKNIMINSKWRRKQKTHRQTDTFSSTCSSFFFFS